MAKMSRYLSEETDPTVRAIPAVHGASGHARARSPRRCPRRARSRPDRRAEQRDDLPALVRARRICAAFSVDAAAGLVFHEGVRRRACVRVFTDLALLLVIAGCHKAEPVQPPADDGSCFGATCVERAEAAMYYGDHESAREPLTAVCEKGDGFQCFRLAELHHHGRGGPVDLDKAAALYEQACTHEHPEGCEQRHELARAGKGGPEVELDFALKACVGERPLGCMRAGEQMNAGRGVERDVPRAVELYERACKFGEVAGCTSAGELLYDPKGPAEAKARALSAFSSACVGHSGYGCLRMAIALHEGVGVPRDVERARAQFTRACEFSEQDGCHNAKLLAEAGGKPITLELTTAAPQIGQGGLEARDITCRMNQQGQPVLDDVMSRVARFKRSLDRCVKDGGVVLTVSWDFEKGHVEDARVRGRASSKVTKCVGWTLRKARMPATGTCQALLLLGEPGAAAKSLEAHIARQQKKAKKKDPHAPKQLDLAEED